MKDFIRKNHVVVTMVVLVAIGFLYYDRYKGMLPAGDDTADTTA